ncbi:hypothetical protein K8I28_05170 [bacterium]|nr:hypothetical protein [bacterium]
MIVSLIVGFVCVSLIITGSVPGLSYVVPYSKPLSTDGVFGRAAGVLFLLGYSGLTFGDSQLIPIVLMGIGLILLIIGLLKGVDQLRTFK